VSKKGKDEKIAVVIGDMDICRIVPFKPVEGKYEIKIDFLENEFNTKCYRLFALRPIEWEIIDSSQFELTYHKGDKGKPLTIHLKTRQTIEGKPTYTNLPLKKIQAPNVNQLFPIPLLKIEVPAHSSPKKYKLRKYHKVLQPDDCNVVEIYMAHSSFDMDAFANKLPGVHLSFLLLSFEIFATNTVLTDTQKSANIMPQEETKVIMTGFDMFDDMKIFAIHYKDQFLDKKLSKINVTFIENELSEAILCMMKVAYPKTSTNGFFDSIYLGGAMLKDVNQPTAPMLRPSIGIDNVISDAFRRNQLTDEEKDKLYWHALQLRAQLRDALIGHQKNSDELKFKLTEKVMRFTEAMKEIKKGVKGLNLTDAESQWFALYPEKKTLDTSLLVAKYLGMHECILYARAIGVPNAEPEVHHFWLLYHDRFDIDAAYSSLTTYSTSELEAVMIAPAEQHPLLAEHSGLRHTLHEKGYERGVLKRGVYQVKEFDGCFKRNDGLLNELYEKILAVMKATEINNT